MGWAGQGSPGLGLLGWGGFGGVGCVVPKAVFAPYLRTIQPHSLPVCLPPASQTGCR